MEDLKGVFSRAFICRRRSTECRSDWPEETPRTFVLWISAIIVNCFALHVLSINHELKLLDFDSLLLIIITG